MSLRAALPPHALLAIRVSSTIYSIIQVYLPLYIRSKDRPTFEEVFIKLDELIPDLSSYAAAYQKESPHTEEIEVPTQLDRTQPGAYEERPI